MNPRAQSNHEPGILDLNGPRIRALEIEVDSARENALYWHGRWAESQSFIAEALEIHREHCMECDSTHQCPTTVALSKNPDRGGPQ